MPKTISASEAKSRFAETVQWILENQDDVIVNRYDQPYVVLMPYADYEQYRVWQEKLRREAIIEQVEASRHEVQVDAQVTDQAEAYRQAGMAEWVICETLEADAARERGESSF